MKTRIIIAGGRDFENFDFLIDKCDDILRDYDGVELVGGGVKGADYLGKEYAKIRDYDYKEFTADWDTHGKAAGPIRNAEMAEYADVLIAFWNGHSRGTSNMINQAYKHQLKTHIITY